MVIYHDGKSAEFKPDAEDPFRWVGVQVAPGASKWSAKTIPSVSDEQIKEMLGQEIYVGGRAGFSVVKLDVTVLETFLKGSFSVQHRSTAKVLVEIAKNRGSVRGCRSPSCSFMSAGRSAVAA